MFRFTAVLFLGLAITPSAFARASHTFTVTEGTMETVSFDPAPGGSVTVDYRVSNSSPSQTHVMLLIDYGMSKQARVRVEAGESLHVHYRGCVSIRVMLLPSAQSNPNETATVTLVGTP